MIELTFERFSDFFRALWGAEREPFAWQKSLAARVLRDPVNPWPEAIALPTASGKSACLDIAVYALASQAHRETRTPLSTARRIFFVVDRRVIVDEAFDRACKLARKLRMAESGILREVADRLRFLSGGDTPLACFQLRGGMYRSEAWAKSPTQPVIVASTVDQYGSRLLFRAYGRRFKAWPIQAGLTGNDALVLLDEAHCAVPFLETLRSVKRYREWAETPLAAPFHVTVMSATPPEEVTDIFRDTSQEPRIPQHPLGARQLCNKPAALFEVKNAKGAEALGELAKSLADKAEELANGRAVAVVVFANRVATARAAHALLAKRHGDRATLLTGRMRPLDKDDVLVHRLTRLSADLSHARQLDAPEFIVATQTLEVGANLDFDVLVTECAALDALRQRFGRLNRMGRPPEASAAILIRADQAGDSTDDPVYGAALANTWRWLNEQSDDSNRIDMGIGPLAERLPVGKELARLNAPASHAPVMLPAHVDCWAQTAPEPEPTPDVSVFLHGPARTSADVQVCWRADINIDSRKDAALEILSLCPPAIGECLPVQLWLFRKWLAGEKELQIDLLADVEGVGLDAEEVQREKFKVPPRRIVLWRGRDETEVIADAGKLRPGDVVVVPTSMEGWDILGDIPRPNGIPPILDWGERAHAAARAKALLRLHASVISQWPDFETKSALLEVARRARALYEDDPEALPPLLRDVLEMAAEDNTLPERMKWLKPIAKNLARDRGLGRNITPHPSGEGLVLRGSKPLETLRGEGEEPHDFSDEDDSSSSGTVGVGLVSHMEGVSDLAMDFAASCHLPADLTEAVRSAARLHDLGKADPRFQALLRGGNPWAGGELLAKSGNMPQGTQAYMRACKAAGYPVGMRHELLSIRLAESAPELLPKDPGLRELVLHLLGSHHGHCRPFAPVVFDDKQVPVSLHVQESLMVYSGHTRMERIDSGASERFWDMAHRHGWWGLAYLEAILRLADHRRSELEETGGEA